MSAYALELQNDPASAILLDRMAEAIAVAVDTCIAAAAHCWNTNWQKVLLRVAAWGKSYAAHYDSTTLITMAQILRALNAIRSAPVGLAVTYSQ